MISRKPIPQIDEPPGHNLQEVSSGRHTFYLGDLVRASRVRGVWRIKQIRDDGVIWMTGGPSGAWKPFTIDRLKKIKGG